MRENAKIVVVGLGEVGRPLLELASRYHANAVGVDLAPAGRLDDVDVLHICFPYEIPDFVGETTRYMELFQPKVTIINSTVGIGTTRAVAERTGRAVVNSPIRGKHVRMLEELQMYRKFIGALDEPSAAMARDHFASLEVQTKTLASPEATELAKLCETTYLGVLVAWAQDMERYCDRAGASYEEVTSFFEEVSYLPPVKFFPGVIGGHCVMPNIEIILRYGESQLLEAIRASNEQKIARETLRRELLPALAGAAPIER